MTLAIVLGDATDYPPAAALIAGARERSMDIRVIAAGLPDADDATLVEPIDIHVLLGTGSPVLREGLALMGLERELLDIAPSAIVVFGSHAVGLAATLIAAKQQIPLWYAGAGRWALESTNSDAQDDDDRVAAPRDEDLISVLASGLLAPTELAATALAAARYDVRRIWVTGPLEAETLERMSEHLAARGAAAANGVAQRGYVAAHVRNADLLPGQPLPMVHVAQMSYLDRISLVSDAAAVITDSIALQLEACLLRVPCLVLAPASPLRETRAVGAAKRCPADPSSIALAVAEQGNRSDREWPTPPMFDTDVSARILALIAPVEANA